MSLGECQSDGPESRLLMEDIDRSVRCDLEQASAQPFDQRRHDPEDATREDERKCFGSQSEAPGDSG